MSKNLGNLINFDKNLDKIALIEGDLKITYRALDILANNVSYLLLKKGIKKGDKVAIISLNSIDYIIIYLGILKLGAVAVLIHFKYTQSQIDYILKENDCKLILKDIGDLEILTDTEFLFNIPIEEEDPAVIIYTSGSTNKPKGVLYTHKRKYLLNIKSKGLKPRTSILTTALSHGAGISMAELELAAHSTLILLPKFDIKDFIENVKKYKPDTIHAVPTMLSMILNEKDFNTKDFNSVKDIYLSSSPLTQKLYNNITKTFPKVNIHNKYGTTESGGGLFYKHPTLPTPPLSVGYPIESIQYKLIDGVLHVKSPSMMLKYIDGENSRVTKDGYFITNDLFRIDEQGFYYYIGRTDDMFINGGNNIYPKQIEESLESHPLVKEAAVIGIEDEIKGHKPYAWVILAGKLTEEQLKEHVLKQLPTTHCPKKIFVKDSFPLNLNNKIDKMKLKESLYDF